MKTVQYEDTDTGNTATHIATDLPVTKKYGNLQNALEEGFAASDGVRGDTAASGGTIRHPEKGDAARPSQIPTNIDNENPGLADN